MQQLREKIERFFHKHFGSHYPAKGTVNSDQFCFQLSAKCKYCGKRLLRDSQGSWFTSACNDKGEPQ